LELNTSAAAERNKEPIAAQLQQLLPQRGRVLEIASGTGQHVEHFARFFPGMSWQPTDRGATDLAQLESRRGLSGLPNILPPVQLDVLDQPWPAIGSFDAVVCINMIHISPWEATLALFAGAARLLAPGALLYTYGPYRFDGVTAPSNEDFDRSLRSRDPRWGVRDLRELTAAAGEHGLILRGAVAMPANNHSLLFRRA